MEPPAPSVADHLGLVAMNVLSGTAGGAGTEGGPGGGGIEHQQTRRWDKVSLLAVDAAQSNVLSPRPVLE